MKKALTILSLLFLLNRADSQVTREWAARYNGPPGNGHDYGYSVAVDASGNVYTTGYSVGIGTGSFDYATVKYNSSGIQQWVTRYNGTGNGTDYAYSIAVDISGNVFVTGTSIGLVSGNYDFVTIKYDASGLQQWVARHDYGTGRSIAVDVTGNVYVTGESLGSGTGSDYTTIKYNTSGVQQWEARYNGPGNSTDDAYSLALDGSGNVYVTGESSGASFFYEYATVKYNSSGVQQWASRYNGPGDGNDFAKSIAVDPAGNVCVTGRSEGIGSNADYATVQYSPSGVEQWAVRYNGPLNAADFSSSIAADISGNVYVTGQSKGGAGGGYYNYATIKYNVAGVQQWVSRYDGPGDGDDIAHSLAIDNSGNVYVTGNSSGTVGFDDYATIKYNSAGVQMWAARYDGPGNNTEECRSIVADGAGNVYVTGFSYGGSGTQYDYATIKYSQSVGIHQISNEVPGQFILNQNYPNPFNPKTIINFQLPVTNFVSLKIYNMLGNEIETLVSENISAGSYSVEWDASKYSSGVYFYKLVADSFGENTNFTNVKKMILSK